MVFSTTVFPIVLILISRVNEVQGSPCQTTRVPVWRISQHRHKQNRRLLISQIWALGSLWKPLLIFKLLSIMGEREQGGKWLAEPPTYLKTVFELFQILCSTLDEKANQHRGRAGPDGMAFNEGPKPKSQDLSQRTKRKRYFPQLSCSYQACY